MQMNQIVQYAAQIIYPVFVFMFFHVSFVFNHLVFLYLKSPSGYHVLFLTFLLSLFYSLSCFSFNFPLHDSHISQLRLENIMVNLAFMSTVGVWDFWQYIS